MTVADAAGPEFGLVLCSQFPPGDDAQARFTEQIEQVHHARDHGFTSVWATQHYLAEEVQYLHPLAVLSRLVPETGDMRIGTAITLLALTHPVDLAEQLATLDILSGGRLVFGAGLGYRDAEFDAFGVPRDRRLLRFRENLDVVRKLWTEDEVTVEGDFGKIAGIRPALRPLQKPHPPVWLAGHTDSALKRAAQRGLPWLAAAAHVDKDYLCQQAEYYRSECARHDTPGEISVIQEIYVGDTDESALAEARDALAAKYAVYHGWGQDKILPESQSFDREFDELRRGRFILGSRETCRDRLAALIEDVRPAHVLLRAQWSGLPHERVMASMNRLTADVIPALEGVRRGSS
ncbi:MAG TPA: LLM class flavin-dependent oxidoreductase [Pseudonocardia sp.]|jgi:alkanesulfonate monooxygenase SsuD/methylene tetrahydromethanopterin reductase-like flavin-dependent oxidoreductase (luciferase family)|nr:LLM class flavin-dependent oxidoreductase [Pseudonocardia sp.]